MKKIINTGVLAVAALSVCALPALSSCGSPAVSNSMHSYWYADPTANNRYENTKEMLVYDVTFDNKGTNTSYSFSYSDGSYTVNLTNTRYEGQAAYRLETDFSIKGSYTIGSQTESFADSITTECIFLSVSDGLRPLYSRRSVHSTSPAAQTATTVENTITVIDEQVSCIYNAALTAATVTKGDKTEEIKLAPSGYFMDNEQLLFFPRALSLVTSSTLSVFNAYTKTQQSLSLSVAPSATSYSLENVVIDGNDLAEYTVNAYAVAIGSPSALANKPISAYYATEDSEGKNSFRHAMLRMDSPLSYNLGTLTYSLKKADFCTK